MIFDFLAADTGADITTSADLARFLELGKESFAGVDVTSESAMRVSAVNACVRILSGSIGTLPFNLYRRRDVKTGKGRDIIREHPVHKILHDRPNQLQSAFSFRETAMSHLLLRGNFYAFKSFVRGRLDELIPIQPDRVRVFVTPLRELFYEISPDSNQTGQTVRLSRDEIFHVPGLSFNGIVGRNPIEDMRNAVGLAQAEEAHGSRLFKNGARPIGLLKKATPFKDKDVRDRVKESFEEAFSGVNVFKTAFLEDGVEYEALQMNNTDAQFLESRRFQVEDIARIFGVPLHLIGETTKATSFGKGIESLSIAYVVFTLMPWTNRFEQAATQQLLTPAERKDHFTKLEAKGLQRGDFKARQEGLQIQRQSGIINADEWRELEDLNPIPGGGGQEFIHNLNMGTTQGSADDGSDDAEDSE